MRGLFSRAPERFERVLLIESGERSVSEKAVSLLYSNAGLKRLDVLTCFDTAPANFDFARGAVASVHSTEATQSRFGYAGKLAHGPYDAIAILCSGSGILRNWKYLIAARSATKVFVFDEYGHSFPFDYAHRGEAFDLLSRRITSSLGIIGEVLRLLGELIAMPFVIGYLTVYAINVHARRWLRVHRARS